MVNYDSIYKCGKCIWAKDSLDKQKVYCRLFRHCMFRESHPCPEWEYYDGDK